MIKLFNFNLLFLFIFLGFVGNYLIIKFWRPEVYFRFGFKKYQAIQKIHYGDVPRLGGFVFFCTLFLYFLICKTDDSNLIIRSFLIPLIPILLIGLKEDIFHHTDPYIRLFFILFSGWLFRVFYLGPYPDMTHLPIISKLLSLQGGAGFFYIFSIAALINGMNLVDGVNGLCTFVAMSILASLLFIAYNVHDNFIFNVIFLCIVLLIPFLMFNFPKGKIFLGDMGSYGLGGLISMIIIVMFGRHPNLSVWLAPFIIIYPLTELIFSILRRFFTKSLIFSADLKHIHILMFKAKFLKHKQYKRKHNVNAMVAPSLFFLWSFPCFIIFYNYKSLKLIFLSILIFVAMYLITYFFLRSNLALKGEVIGKI